MQTKIIPFSEFKETVREAVLKAMDAVAKTTMESEKVDGWKDNELPALFTGIDAHALALAKRINAGGEVNSAFARIDMAA